MSAQLGSCVGGPVDSRDMSCLEDWLDEAIACTNGAVLLLPLLPVAGVIGWWLSRVLPELGC